MKKLMLLAVLAAGYVLGARAGRERYEQIVQMFDRVRNDPRVQDKAHQAADLARQQAPVVAEKDTSADGAAATKVTSTGGVQAQAVKHMAGPQGDLP